MSRKTAEIVKRGALLFASLLVTVVVSELALRATGYRPTLADPAMYVANDHEHLPYRMRPHYEGFYMGQPVRLDGDGYRVVEADSSVPYEQTVLLLGDSVVFGHGLAGDEAPAAQLQKRLAERRVRIRGAAVSGYTSWNELAALEAYVAKHAVDAVVLVYLENDITFDHNQLRVSDGEFGNIGSGALHRVTQAMYRHVYLSYLVRNSLERVQRLVAARPDRSREPTGADAPDPASTIPQYTRAATPPDIDAATSDAARSPLHDPARSPLHDSARPSLFDAARSPLHDSARPSLHDPSRSPLDDPAFAHSLEALTRMKALCEREGIAFTVGIYRDVTYYADPHRVRRYETRLGETLAEHGIHSFVIGSHVEQLDLASVRLSWNDPHPTGEAVSIFVDDIRRAVGPILDP